MRITAGSTSAMALVCLLQATLLRRATPQSSPGNVCYVVSYDRGGLVLWVYDHFLEHFRRLLDWLDRHPKLCMRSNNEARISPGAPPGRRSARTSCPSSPVA